MNKSLRQAQEDSLFAQACLFVWPFASSYCELYHLSLSAHRVFDVHADGRGVRHIPQSALLGVDVLDDEVLLARRLAHVDV